MAAMEIRVSRLLSTFFILAAALSGASASQAAGFTVHSYELGERIALTNGTQVWTAQLDVSIEDVASHVPSFCVDVFSTIGVGEYETRDLLDADTAVAPVGEQARNFAWAGHVMQTYGSDIAGLVSGGVTRAQAITGVQAAIWQGIYGGDMINRYSLSTGARSVFDQIMNSQDVGTDDSWIAEFRGSQDQVFVRPTNPIPEPSAALMFGLGTAVAGSVLRRRV
jgi:hypothetical protein